MVNISYRNVPHMKEVVSMKKLSKLFSIVLAMVMILGMSTTTALASEAPATTDNFLLSTDLDSLDLDKPFTETKYVTDSDGNQVTLKLSFTPAPSISPMGSSTNPASVGTWTSSVDMGVIKMSYKFDLSKSGSQWKISNGREHSYSGLFCTFSNNSLSISRSTSTSSFPAEINASVDAQVFDNAWVPLYSGTWLMSTTVSSGGTMTLTWN